MLETNATTQDPFKQSLIDWTPETFNNIPVTRWHKGQISNRLPNKTEMNLLQMDCISQGWTPTNPFIFPKTRVVAIGSCFAGYFIKWLADNGFNQAMPKSPYNALLRFGSEFENIAVIAQQFRWAFGELDTNSLLWIDKNKEIFDATDDRRQLVRDTLLNTDVLLITLGLSEVWYDKESNEPMWRAITSSHFDPKKHVFKVESFEKTLYWLNTIERLRQAHVPNMKIVFTVSPVRFSATFRPISAITANNVSKAILRASLDEFLRTNTHLNNHLFYFPSFEFVTEYFIDSYEHDQRHIVPSVINTIINHFVHYYCSKEINDKSATKQRGSINPENELLTRINLLEKKVVELQKVCDDRLEVIQGLASNSAHPATLSTMDEKLPHSLVQKTIKWFKKFSF